jgi:hypothetical protein
MTMTMSAVFIVGDIFMSSIVQLAQGGTGSREARPDGSDREMTGTGYLVVIPRRQASEQQNSALLAGQQHNGAYEAETFQILDLVRRTRNIL